MATRENLSAKQIVPASSQALAVRSAAIVARGLRDLARDSNWLVKKVFSGNSPYVSISSAGQLCAVSPVVRHGTERIALYDIELSVPVLALTVPDEPEVSQPGSPAVFAWSPSARHLVGAWGGWLPELHIFDLRAKIFLGGFGDFAHFPSSLAWSDSGKFFAAASHGGADARMRLWEASPETASMPFAAEPTIQFGSLDLAEWRILDAESDGEGAFSGFGRTAFSPDEGMLASVVEIEGEWADDSIAILEVPTLRRHTAFQAQGHITDLSWTIDSRQLIYCSSGQAYRLGAGAAEAESLPFGAELCACHPRLPVCLCFSSWLKNSAKGRLFLVDLNRLTVFDEHPAEGIIDLRWSLDGSKAYAVTADGLAYIYEPPLL
ncbi:MAG: WD40 repeat domain-containing protein [Candidatus Acidiferrales bacterium]|jgi:WD40 repeat protein